MGSLGEDYLVELSSFKENYKTLKEKVLDHEYLDLVVLNKYGEILLKPEFWDKFGPENKETSHYNLHTLIEANKQFEKVIKDLTSKLD